MTCAGCRMTFVTLEDDTIYIRVCGTCAQIAGYRGYVGPFCAACHARHDANNHQGEGQTNESQTED